MRVRTTLFFVACAAVAAVGTGCGEDAAKPPFASLQWLLRCQAMGGCTGYTTRDIANFNGELGHMVTCSVQQRTSGKELFFSAFQGSAYGVEVRNLYYTEVDGVPSVAGGASCSVRVLEDGNEFVGGCGPNAPSTAQPCQFTDFALDPTMHGVTGKLQCSGLHQTTAPTILRELTGPAGATMPVVFEIDNCNNL